MAKAKTKKPATKKKATKSATKKGTSAKKPAAKKAKAPAKRASKPRATKKVLTGDARRRLLKPRSDYEELIEQVAVHWEQHRVLRVPGLSAARLRKLGRDALRAVTKETSLRAKLEQQIAAVSDARLIAEDAAWRAILDVNAAVKLFARSDATLPERFAFLTDALTSSRSGNEPTVAFNPTPTPDPNQTS